MAPKSRHEKVRVPQNVEEKIEFGKNAELILASDVFVYAVAATEETFIREWRAADTAERREMAWAKMHALSEVQRMLRTIMDHGQLESARVTKDSR